MAKCFKCGKMFAAKADKSGRCKACKSVYNRQHYVENKATYLAKAKRNELNQKIKNCRLVCEYLSTHPCVDCGELDPIVLEFDHVGPKLADVGTLLRKHSWKLIAAEIAKCEVRCANCHRRVTARRAGWLRLKMLGVSPLIIDYCNTWTTAA